MMAGLVDARASNIMVYCGGTILSNYYVLSSAHCVVGKPVAALLVLVGDHDYNSGET